MEKFKNEQQGIILLFTLLIMLTLTILGMTMIPLTVIEYKTSKNFSDYEKAYFIAEAGLEETIAQLNDDWENYIPTNLWQSLKDEDQKEQGQFKIFLEDIGENLKIITSTGKVGNIQRTIKVEIEKSNKYSLEQLIKYTVFIQKNLNLEDQVTINGDVNVLGSLINNECEITGEVSKKPLGLNIDNYIQVLENSENTIKEKSNKENDFYDLPNNISEAVENHPVYILEDFKSVVLENQKIFSGLLILKNVEILEIKNESMLNGIILFINDSKIENIRVIWNGNATINGNLITVRDSVTIVNKSKNGKLNINYMNTQDFLPNINNFIEASDFILKINYYKEVL
ncbi:PilX N-terminal domain-containing pilus assembly protein [Garciella nitratireducens]|uniref:Type 4 fimbrial biogenesis protein PilX N-terminal domain-containing protein n=1 Tax=Garciella nitratireducens DSM 15102 TaxID=1121911 RepID=A0A1T4K530_9FIRM|nr:PilX N-terminal domain-containing pilus assembly protein [Garciella nitratireducens]RBP46674.1 hypothetical protein DFR81_10166 [Garciella nitratireducens]SJZ37437.1 hypothetical protein SAMN02745973_00343 [Garciella nitratireducens DSM 15102]